MFGRSSAPRFKDKVDSTPGPGDYNAQAVSASSKRGPSMGIGARTLHTPASEFAHLGPGFYSLDGEPSFGDHARRGAVLRAGALDYAAALKKLAASLSTVMGPAAGHPGASQRELSREEICGLAGKLVAESTAVCSDVVRIKGELDGINSRVKDEVNAALKPSKATGSAGNPSAWKIYTPLEKALENTSGDLAKKLAKLSSFLAALHEGFPALAVALADGDRIGQLSQMVEMLEVNLEAVQKQGAESAAAAEAACQENQALQRELAGYKRLHMQQLVRADKLEALLASQKEIVHTLEEQIEASHVQQDALWSQLLAQDGSDPAEPCAYLSHQDLYDECKESRDAHAQTLQELHALQLQMTEVLVQNEHEKALMEEQMLAESDSASSAANEMLSEIDECRALLMQSHRDKRIIRGTVSAMEASRRALRSCLAAGAQELSALHADMAEGDVLPLSMASPQMLRPEAKEAVSQLDRSLTDDLLASQTKVEELTEALSSTEQQLLDAQLELTKLQEETAARSADAHSQDLHLTDTIEGLMHSHDEAEQHLRAEFLAQEEVVRDLQEQLLLLRQQHDEKMECINNLNTSLANLTSQFQSFADATSAQQEQLLASAVEAQTRHTEAMETALQQHCQERAAHEAKLAQTIAKYEQDLSDKALEADALAEQVAQVVVAFEGTRSAQEAELASLANRLKQEIAVKDQLQATKMLHEDIIAQLEGELQATKEQLSATQADLSQTQGELERTTLDLESKLAVSREQVAQLLEAKAHHEDVIAQLEGELQSTREQLSTTQDNMGRSQEEVAQLTATKVQHEDIIAQLEGELQATKEQLSATQADLSQTQGELERTTRDLQGDLAGKVESIGVLEQQLAMTQSKLDLRQRELERALDTLTATAERLQEEALQVAADMQAMHQSNLNKMQAALRQQQAEAESKLAHAAEKQAQVQELLEGELAAHECTTEDLARTKQELERNTCDLQGQIAASQEQVAQLAVTKAQHEEMIAQLQSELGATKEQLAQTQHELERTTFALQGQLASSQEEVAQLIITKAQHVDTIAQLEAQLDATKQQLSQTESDLEASAQLEEELRQSLAKTEAALQNALAEASNLGGQLAQVSEQLARVSADRDDKAQRVDLLSAHALELSNNLQDERTQRQAESERAAEEAESAAQHFHAAEIAHKEAELAQDERISKLDACVGHMETEVRESKMLLRDMTTRIDARASVLMTQLQHSDADLSEHKQKLEDALQQLSDAREAHAAEMKKFLHNQALTLEEMQAQHTQDVNDWQSKLSEAQEQHAAELQELQRWASEAREAASVEHQQAMEQQKAHSDAVKAQLSDKVQQVQQHASELTRSLEAARADLSKTNQEAQTAREDAERELAAAQSKIDMLRSALKGTEQEKAQALAAISNMYVHTDQQLKAMAGAGAPHSADAGSIARIATLQVCLHPPTRAFVSLAPCRRTRILLAFT